MGVRNFLIEGVSCSGKTAVLKELRARGYCTVDGDNELAHFDNNRNWIWDIDKVRTLVADQSTPVTFFCGGSRNSEEFVSLFDGVFILDIDLETLNRRLAARPKTEWGGTAEEGESFARLQHATKQGLPKDGIIVDATAPLESVVSEILSKVT